MPATHQKGLEAMEAVMSVLAFNKMGKPPRVGSGTGDELTSDTQWPACSSETHGNAQSVGF